MFYISSHLWIFIFIEFISWIRGEKQNGTEQRLFQDLFDTYDVIPRPINNISQPVVIKFGIALNQILDLEEKRQALTTSVWISESWVDDNLKWNPTDYDGLDRLMVSSTFLWVPDIFIFNTAGGELDGFVNVTGSKILIENNGQIHWTIPLMMKSACEVDVTYFPYDKQECVVNFGSWIYDWSMVDIQTDGTEPDVTNYIPNSEFSLLDVSLYRTVVNESCCPGPGDHPMVHFYIKMKRKSIYYDYIVIAPTIMLCVLTLATFMLPCHHGEKISIGLTVFLTLYVLQLLIAENVPDTNTTPVLGVFIFLVMTFNCISLIMATIVMNIKKRGNTKTIPEVPDWVLKFCENILSKVVCTRSTKWNIQLNLCEDDKNENESDVQKYRLEQRRRSSGSRRFKGRLSESDIFHVRKETAEEINMAYHSSGEESDDSSNEEDGEGNLSANPSLLGNPHFSRKFNINRSYKRLLKYRPSYRKAVNREQLIDCLYEQCTGNDAEQVQDEVRRSDSDQPIEEVVELKRKWYFVAESVDKAAFLVYLISMFITVVTVLVIVPSFS